MSKQKILLLTIGLILCSLIPNSAYAQDDLYKKDTLQKDTTRQMVVVIKNDGTEHIGYIISQDDREVHLETEKLGGVYIPKHEIKEIKNISDKDVVNNQYMGDPVFDTRYFFTTNGYNGKKGEHYIIWNLWGPDAQFAISDNVTIGGMSSWIGMPLLATIKVGSKPTNGVAFGAGLLAGPLAWAVPEAGFLALAYGSVTFGKPGKNINFSAGYGGSTEGGASDLILSVGSHQQLSKKFSFIFDSFILPSEGYGFISPGFRIDQGQGKAIQLGFIGVLADGELLPVPFPMVSWMRTL